MRTIPALAAALALLLPACVTQVAPGNAGRVDAGEQGELAGQARIAADAEAGINAARAAAGLAPLAADPRLRRAAAAHAADMAARGYFDHTSPSGTTPADRVAATGYDGCLIAENIARGQADAAAVVQSWQNSPGHRANNLNPQLTQLGVAEGAGKTWVAVFARPC